MSPIQALSVRRIVAQVQKEAYAAIGMQEEALREYFARERQRVDQFLADKPAYLQSREEILAEDPSLDYVELDLSKRFDRPTPTPFQHPFLYSWLADSWRYHCEHLYGRHEALRKPMLLATAPSGCFNAMTLAGRKEHAILLEDGLLNVLIGISNQLAFLLYQRLDARRYVDRSLQQVSTYAESHPELTGNITSIIRNYVVEGYSRQPAAIGDAHHEDFAIRHVMSTACWSFVFEHELFHLRLRDNSEEQPPIDERFLEERYRQVWQLFDRQLHAHLPIEIEEHIFKARYLAHQEELFADHFGLAAVIRSARKDQTLSASISGVLLFFLAAELTEYLLFELTQPQAIDNLYAGDGLTVSLTAIVTDESHPYAFARRQAMMSNAFSQYQDLEGIFEEQQQKIIYLLDLVREQLKSEIGTITTEVRPHAKWAFGKQLMGRYPEVRRKV